MSNDDDNILKYTNLSDRDPVVRLFRLNGYFFPLFMGGLLKAEEFYSGERYKEKNDPV